MILMNNIRFARDGFKNLYDKHRVGFLIHVSNNIGVTLGGIFTKIW